MPSVAILAAAPEEGQEGAAVDFAIGRQGGAGCGRDCGKDVGEVDQVIADAGLATPAGPTGDERHVRAGVRQ